MNWEQVKGVVERLATMLVMYAAGAGWIPQDIAGSVVTVVVTLASIGWGLWVNTPAALSTAAQKVK